MNPAARLRFIGIAVAVTLGTAPVAQAQVAIAWNNCLGKANAAQSLQYVCDGSRDGIPFKLVLSYELPAFVDSIESSRSIVEFRTANPSLPDYWQLLPGGCREGGGPFFQPVSPGVGDPVLCANASPGQNGSGNFVTLIHPPNSFRYECSIGTTLIPIQGGKKYLGGVMLLDPVSGDCAGCEEEICIQFVEVSVIWGTDPDPNAPRPEITLSGPNSTSFVTWQGPAPGICFGATPVRDRTWGSVKALYR